MRRPFWKAQAKCWCIKTAEGKVVRLSPDEQQAQIEWAKLLAGKRAGMVVGLTLGQLATKYLAWVECNRSKATHESYKRYLDRWTKHHAKLGASEARPHHLTEIIGLEFPKNKCGETSHWQFYKVAMVMFNWAADQKLPGLESSPLGKIKNRPKCGRRRKYLSKENYDKLVAACDDPLLLDVLLALWETGARPHEIFKATAANLDRDSKCLRYVLGKGKKPRIVYLKPKIFERFCQLAERYPEGPMLRNTIGCSWNSNLLSARLRILKKRTGVTTCAYEFRHSFCTRAIKQGIDLRTLQELMGHSDLAMISEIYAHLHGDDAHLHDALDKLDG
jgi:integrase